MPAILNNWVFTSARAARVPAAPLPNPPSIPGSFALNGAPAYCNPEPESEREVCALSIASIPRCNSFMLVCSFIDNVVGFIPYNCANSFLLSLCGPYRDYRS
mgnify:CR=1 FL=1